MFIAKKIITSLIHPPGVFIILMFLCGMAFLFRRGVWKAGLFCMFMAVCIWATAISPVSNFLLQRLEYSLGIPKNPKGDVIIVLGGGAYDGVPDMTGAGFPSGDSAGRLITAARLYRLLNVPMIVSGGSGFASKQPEAPLMKRVLVDLGVPEHMVIVEERSRDTFENARYSTELCRNYRLDRPIVVTSAYHMERAVLSFERQKMKVTPYPAGSRSWKGRVFTWDDYLPDASSQRDFVLGAKEYIGLIWYQFYY